MSNNNQNQRLNGFTPLSYIGSNPVQPTNFTMSSSSPTTDDSRGFNIGDWWLNTTNNSIWYLAASNGLTATWIQVMGSGTGLLELTGNSGGPVPPTLGNIDLLGDELTVFVTGNSASSTLTMTSTGPGFNLSLTGNSGGAVSPTAGNINIVGTGDISVVGNPGTSTLDISQSDSVVIQYVTQSGTAVPSAGVLKVFGSNQISTSGAGSTVTVTGGSALAQSFITSPPTGTAVPVANTLTFSGTGGTSVSAGGSTVTFTGSGALPFFSTGTFTPNLAFGGSSAGITYASRFGQYVRMGNLVSIQISFRISPTVPPLGGNGEINGLPFTVSNSYGSFFMETSAFGTITQVPSRTTTPFYMWGRFNPGTTKMTIYGKDLNLSLANAAIVTSSSFTNALNPGNVLHVQGFYFV